MKISSETKVKDVFNQFNQVFPFLRLEFYKSAHEDSEGSKIEDQVSHDTLIKDLNPDINETIFEIDSQMSVADFEKMMRQNFGLNVQVFRKSASIWLQTTATDAWSLEKQNGKGERSIVDYDIQPVEMKDFDLE